MMTPAATARRAVSRRKRAIEPAARDVRRQGKKVVTNPWVERAARLGYVVRGVIYGTMGVLALGLAWALQLPAGAAIVTVAGVIGILGGLGQFGMPTRLDFARICSATK
jgi:hypothetical protein